MKRQNARPSSVDPILRFRRWMAQARRGRAVLPEAMVVATADRRGRPSARFVLLKHCDDRGFVFYTDTRSRKGGELRENPFASLVIYWEVLRRQVRIEGRVEPVSPAEADLYWETRPPESQIAAAVSRQSGRLDSRRRLLRKYGELQAELSGRPVPRPPWWSGYRVRPTRIEFWIHREHRLHERELFIRSGSDWRRELLQP